MSTANIPSSLRQFLVILGLLGVAILFDDGRSIMTGFGLNSEVQQVSSQAADVKSTDLNLLCKSSDDLGPMPSKTKGDICSIAFG